MQQFSIVHTVEKNLFALFSGPKNVCRRTRHHRYIGTAMLWSSRTWFVMHTNIVHTLRVWRFILKSICVRCRMKVNFGLCDRFFAAIYYYLPVNFIVYRYHFSSFHDTQKYVQSACNRQMKERCYTERGRERGNQRKDNGNTTAATTTTITKQNENYFIWLKRSQEWYTDSINPSRSLYFWGIVRVSTTKQRTE